MVMNVKQDIVSDRSALANNNVGNTVANTGYGGGRGHGRGGNHGGGCGGDRGRGPFGGSRGYCGQPNLDCDKLYWTHCGRYRHTRETCWDLNGTPQNVSATPAEVEHTTETTE